MLLSFVVLSLFISVVSRTMFEVMDVKSFDDERVADLRRLKHQHRLIREGLADPASELHRAIETFFARARRRADRDDDGGEAQRGYAWAAAVSKHAMFEGVITLAILAAAFLEAVSVDEVGEERHHRLANFVILSVFTVEILLKLLALAHAPLTYFRDGWNRFDFGVVAMAYVDIIVPLGSIAVLRLLRLLKVM